MKLSRSESSKSFSLIKLLEKMPESYGFRLPVDHVGLGLYDYLTIIRHPMDLSTVKKNLQENKYEGLEEVMDDLQLIWDNCRLYNPPECGIVAEANILEEAMRKLSIELGLPLPGAIRQPKPVEIPHEEKSTLAELIQKVSHDTLAHIVTVVENESPTAATHLDKNRVLIELDKLSPSAYSKVKEIIEAEAPSKKPKLEGDTENS